MAVKSKSRSATYRFASHMKSEHQEKNKSYVGAIVTVSKVVNMTSMCENVTVIGILLRHTVRLWEWDTVLSRLSLGSQPPLPPSPPPLPPFPIPPVQPHDQQAVKVAEWNGEQDIPCPPTFVVIPRTEVISRGSVWRLLTARGDNNNGEHSSKVTITFCTLWS